MAAGANILGTSDRPLFFRVSDPAAVGLSPPEPRLGHSLRLAVRSLSAMQKEALVANSRTGAVWRLASDEGAYLAGHDEAPCPLSFLTVGMVCSTLNEIEALAHARGIVIRDITLVQDNYYTMKGSALRGTMTGGARDMVLEARIDANADPDTTRALVMDAVAASPVTGLMRGKKDSLFSLTHNGRGIPTGKANPVDGPALADPGDRFDVARPAPGDWSGLIVRGGASPITGETVTRAGDSLAEEQDRVLHIRGICRNRAGGIREVEQQMFNPHGSVFHFLCEEGPEGGGKGRAPDAASYLAAGFGFCFMTQFGRYAKIARKDLKEYRIIQDAHFSLGGASGGTGKPGAADPLETQVYLMTGEDDDFARTILDMAEQTCFLHAFCRTDLKTRVRVTMPAAA